MSTIDRVKALIVGGAVGFALLIGMLQVFEGTVYDDYLDVIGVATTCTGHTGPDVVVGKHRTPHECRAILERDARKAWDAADRYATVELSPGEQIAYADFIYNFGEGAFTTSTMRRKLNSGDRVGACNELPRWKYAKGRMLPGLVVRRDIVRKLCLGETL